MKMYRLALSEENANAAKSRTNLAFNALFGDNLRYVIPISNQEITKIQTTLENGNTKTKTKYIVDISKGVAYRIKDGVTDPRPMKLGKVILKELGQEVADEWSRQVNSLNEDGLSIVISRSPIDVMRMSDHSGISSCHSEHREYFDSTKEEALDGGAIAYIVRTDLLKSFLGEKGEEALQSPEIFYDGNRLVDGIEPISRLRINRYVPDDYVDGDDPDGEIAIPVTHIYGKRVAGFTTTVRKWLRDEQSKYIDFDELSMKNYMRMGGTYADSGDGPLIKEFFDGDNKGVNSDLPHKGGMGRLETWKEELAAMCEEANKEFTHGEVWAEAITDDGHIYIDAGATMKYQMRGEILKNLTYQNAGGYGNDNVFDISDGLKIKDYGHIGENLDFTELGGIITLSISVDLGYEQPFNNPDEFKSEADDLVHYNGRYYVEDLFRLKDNLIEGGFIDPIDDVGDSGSFFNRDETKFNISDDDDTVDIYIKVPNIQESKLYDQHNAKELENFVAQLFNRFISVRMKQLVKGAVGQENFSFYQDVPIKFTANDYGIDMEVEVTVSYASKEVIVQVPIYELVQRGQVFVNVFTQAIKLVENDIANALHEKERIAQGGQENQAKRDQEWAEMEKADQEIEREMDEASQKVEALSWYSNVKVSEALGREPSYFLRNI